MKVIYLASFEAKLKYKNAVYQDINGKRDLDGDMLEVDLTPYDILIATPPCNYYSRANYRRETSIYAQKTKHLLPDIIEKFSKTGKSFIVENVINKVLMKDIIRKHIDKGFYYKELGRHCYFMSHDIDISMLDQINDNVRNVSKNKRQGGYNVNIVLDYYIEKIKGVYNEINKKRNY